MDRSFTSGERAPAARFAADYGVTAMMQWLYLGSGILMGGFVLKFFWNYFFARSFWNPAKEAIERAKVALICAEPKWVKNDDTFTFAGKKTTISFKRGNTEEFVTVKSGKLSVSFYFYNGQLVHLTANGENFGELHPVMKESQIVSCKFLNLLRKCNGFPSYGNERSGVYEHELAERKQRSQEHKRSVEERLNKNKRKPG